MKVIQKSAPLLTFILFSVCLSACAPTIINPEIVKIETPEEGEENVAELGDTILKKGVVRVYDAVVLNNTLTAGQVALAPQTLVARTRTSEFVNFYADIPLVLKPLVGGRWWIGDQSQCDAGLRGASPTGGYDKKKGSTFRLDCIRRQREEKFEVGGRKGSDQGLVGIDCYDAHPE